MCHNAWFDGAVQNIKISVSFSLCITNDASDENIRVYSTQETNQVENTCVYLRTN